MCSSHTANGLTKKIAATLGLLLLGPLFVSAFAATEKVGYITWHYDVENGEAVLLTCLDNDGSRYLPLSGIPEKLGGYPVTVIADDAFYRYSYPYRDRLHDQTITIPSTVRKIGKGAFCDCQCLTRVELSEGLVEIGDDAFSGCRLALIDGIPSTVRKIGSNAFALTKIYNLVIPEGVQDIPDRAFYKCKNLREIPLPSTVTNIGDSAFAYAPVGRMDFPAALSRIGDKAFYWCLNLTNLTFQGTIPELGSQSFKECDGLADENGLVIVGDVLYDAPLSGDVAIPAVVKTIGAWAFYPETEINDDYHDMPDNWTKHNKVSDVRIRSIVTSVVLPSTVREIGNQAFYDCLRLEMVQFRNRPPIGLDASGLSKSVEVQYPAAFAPIWETVLDDSGFTNAVSFVPPNGGPYLEKVDGIEWTYMVTNGLASLGGDSHFVKAVPESVAGVLNIPDVLGGCLVGRIGDYAFYERTNITSVTIPTTVTNIGYLAFHKCSGLGDGVIISDGCVLTVNGICPTIVSLPEGTRIIGSGAFFHQNNLCSVIMPASVKKIEPEAFYWCENLRCMVFEGKVAPSCSQISHVKAYCTMHARTGSTGWGCEIPGKWNGINIAYFDLDISSGVVKGCSGTIPEVIHIPASHDNSPVESIGVSAFSDRSFYNVLMPETIRSIGDNAFNGCRYLKEVNIPKGVTNLGYACFAYCDGLKTVTLPENLEAVPQNAFNLCDGLSEIGIPPSVKSIGYWSFYGCPIKTVHVASGDRDRVAAMLSSFTGVVYLEDLPVANIFPVLPDDASIQEIATALQGAADQTLVTKITDISTYNAYCQWAGTVKGAGGSLMGQDGIKKAANTWQSFALNQASLLETVLTDADLLIDTFEPSSESGKFEFTVSVKDVVVGSEATKENLKKVFGLAGAATFEPAAFSSDKVDIEFETPVDGKVKFTATPKDDSSGSFFMKVKMLP